MPDLWGPDGLVSMGHRNWLMERPAYHLDQTFVEVDGNRVDTRDLALERAHRQSNACWWAVEG